ncbi:MAG TPA: dTMP kinase [Candidatus Baltobacteraceae bacterium]|nr:dTMP kinase [Candidatus Baltobacteraceae bacterium]
MFISFEGIEGSGKSTVMAAVERALRSEGREVVVTREPGGTPVGDAAREILLHKRDLAIGPLAELMLMNASRAQLVQDVIRPALQRGAVVLSDRYMHSSLAYQGYGRGLPQGVVRAVCDAATGRLMPDLVLLVDISYETSRARLSQRGAAHDRMESEDEAFHRRIREGYLEIAKHDERVVRIDGERAPEEVADAALAALSAVVDDRSEV